jgi:hypothetical protein
LTTRLAEKFRTYGREKIIILALWFVCLTGIRLLLGSFFAINTTWIGTTGAIGITFAAFYIALKFTPLARYSKQVNSALVSWYTTKYLLWGLVGSMIALSALIGLVEFGYSYHSASVASFEELKYSSSNGYDHSAALFQKVMKSSISGTSGKQLPSIDALSILIASVDKSLDGQYVKAVSFILAEDVEILIFMIFVRRSRGFLVSGKNKN